MSLIAVAGMPVARAEGPRPLKIVGTQIEDDRGHPVLLRGVNAACMEFTSDGQGHILDSVKTAIEDWHANIIRLPLSQDRWFGKAPEQTDGGVAYRALIAQIVDTIEKHNCYVILDLHWSDADQWGQHIGQHLMPDENSIAFWKDFAPVYANNPSVIFDLYNEPHDVPWITWLEGGPVSETDRRTGVSQWYYAAGMQDVLDTIRSTGAKNVVIAGGLNWAYDMKGFLNGYQLRDPEGNGVIYSNHFYTVKGETIAQWIRELETANKTIPVILSEFGDNTFRRRARPAGAPAGGPPNFPPRPPGVPEGPPPNFPRRPQVDAYDWNKQVLDACAKHGWSFVAWDFHTSAGPTLISDWNYTPTPEFGALVKATLLGQPLPPKPDPTAPPPPADPTPNR